MHSAEPPACARSGCKALTTADLYLGHADPRDWEPGDAQFYFPVAAQIFYGYRPLEGYRIERGDDCATFDVKESANVDAGGDRVQAKKYEVSCKAKNATTARVVAHSKQNWTAEEDEPAVVLGSSLVFEAGVKLTKVGPKQYKLDASAVPAATP